MSEIRLRPKTSTDQVWITQFLQEYWHDVFLPLHGSLIDASTLPALIAEIDDEPIGLLTYTINHPTIEIISLNASRKRMGVGSTLLSMLERICIEENCTLLQCAISNDNTNGFRFLQKRGFRLVKVNIDALDHSRLQNKLIPIMGEHQIPLHDELIFYKPC